MVRALSQGRAGQGLSLQLLVPQSLFIPQRLSLSQGQCPGLRAPSVPPLLSPVHAQSGPHHVRPAARSKQLCRPRSPAPPPQPQHQQPAQLGGRAALQTWPQSLPRKRLTGLLPALPSASRLPAPAHLLGALGALSADPAGLPAPAVRDWVCCAPSTGTWHHAWRPPNGHQSSLCWVTSSSLAGPAGRCGAWMREMLWNCGE